MEASNLLPDAGIDGATSEQSAIGEEEDSEDDEESHQKFGDLSCPVLFCSSAFGVVFEAWSQSVSSRCGVCAWEAAAHGFMEG